MVFTTSIKTKHQKNILLYLLLILFSGLFIICFINTILIFKAFKILFCILFFICAMLMTLSINAKLQSQLIVEKNQIKIIESSLFVIKKMKTIFILDIHSYYRSDDYIYIKTDNDFMIFVITYPDDERNLELSIIKKELKKNGIKEDPSLEQESLRRLKWKVFFM